MNKIPFVSPVVGKLTAVLYSIEQDCFHLEQVQDYLISNIKRCLPKFKCTDYRLICICNSDIEGDSFIENFRLLQSKIEKASLEDLINKALQGKP